MRLYRLGNLGSLDALTLAEANDPEPGLREIVVRIHACSLNHRDLSIVSGAYARLALKPAAGAHTLTLVDQYGQRLEYRFKILERE